MRQRAANFNLYYIEWAFYEKTNVIGSYYVSNVIGDTERQLFGN